MHEVVTGVCLRSNNQIRLFSSVSKVWFRNLSDEEIGYYVNKYNPLDKAGAYGIQEWIGYAGIERIEGSFYNVMGLPVQTLYSELFTFVNR
jgi:septum formation protein